MGGDHKCPLCSATFTRPQHVGRHLRAHTGDRPYECKECPLRFARSDLLSRHVNKAHPKPNGAPTGKHDKKGRSKSLSTATVIAPTRPPPMVPNVARPGPHQPEPTAYQAQRMYPNHPLLQQNHNIAWSTGVLDLHGGGIVNFNNMGLGGPTGHLGSDVMGYGNATAPGMASMHPFGGPQMTYAASDTGLAMSSDLATGLPNLGPHAGSTMLGYELNTKKRACDQCNHSKVRCDFADPCARCSHRHVQCTYTKPQRTTRTRNVTYPIPGAHITTSPVHRTQSLQHPPTSVFGTTGTMQHENDPVGMARRGSEQSTASSDYLSSDPHRAERVLPPVPNPQWHNGTTLHPRSHSMSTVSSSVGNGSSLVSQSPNSMLGLTLTPTLTNEPSPSTSDDTDRRATQGSMTGNPNWVLPPSILNQKSAMNFVNNFVAQQNGDMTNLFQGNPQLMWPNHPGGIDTSMMPTESALSISEDGASPKSATDDDGLHRRRSSASMWANALKEMRLDDSTGSSLQLDPTLGLEQLPFQMSQTVFKTGGDEPSSGLERNVSGSELNLWKLFLDPGAMATPGRMNPFDFNHDTPRCLNKSNSAPDLTTPIVDANFANPLESFGEKTEVNHTEDVAKEGDKPNKAPGDDDEALHRWKDQIQMRHASFSMDPGAEATVRTRALTNATFASSLERQLRPSLHPLMQSSGGDKTLAPERLPSFGPAAFDMNDVLLTPGFRGGHRTPTRLVNKFAAIEKRPSNKRQASQTLIGDTQKRSTFLIWPDEEDNTASEASSRRGSTATHGLPAALQGKTNTAPQRALESAWQAAEAPQAC